MQYTKTFDTLYAFEANQGSGYTPGPLNPTLHRDLASAYVGQDHRPTPSILRSYEVFADCVGRQYRAAQHAGFRFLASSEASPYPDADTLAQSVLTTGELVYAQTTSTGEFPDDHPMLGLVFDAYGAPIMLNDAFRCIHDMLGHVPHGNSFDAAGEDNAYRAHRATIPVEGWLALTLETRAQAATNFYGPHGPHNRACFRRGELDDINFAPQKLVHLPTSLVHAR